MSESQQGCCLWIGDLSVWLDENWLRRTFASTKSLVSCKVIRHKATQMSRGYGFLLFNSHEAASQVLNNLNGKPIPGTDQVFRLNWAANGRQNGVASTDYSLFVGDLVEEATDYLLQESFRRYYPSVRSAKVMRAPLSGKSRNFGFCRFGSEQERDQALLEMNGHEICGRPVRVSLATAKKTQTPTADQPGPSGSFGPGSTSQDSGNVTLFVGSLSDHVTEEQLHEMFALFGDLTSVKHLPNRKCAFIQFSSPASAKNAMTVLQDQLGHGPKQINVQVVGGSPIRISWGRQGSSAARPTVPYAPNPAYGYPGPASGGFPQSRPAGMPMYLPPGVRNQSPQVYPRNFNPYVDELSAAAAALSLGGQPLIQDAQSMFPQAALHRQQQMEGLDPAFQGTYGGLPGVPYPRGHLH